MKKSGFVFVLLLMAMFIAHYLFLATGGEYTECLTDSWCLNSKSETLLLALVYTVTRGLMIAAGLAAIAVTIYFMSKKSFFAVVGIICIMIAVTATIALVRVTPRGELVNYMHIFIISFMVCLLGFVFFYAQWKSRTQKGLRDR